MKEGVSYIYTKHKLPIFLYIYPFFTIFFLFFIHSHSQFSKDSFWVVWLTG